MSAVVALAGAAAFLVASGVGPRRALLRARASTETSPDVRSGAGRDLEDVLVAVGAQLRAGRPPADAWASVLGRPADGDVPELAVLVAACEGTGRGGGARATARTMSVGLRDGGGAVRRLHPRGRGRDDERLVARAAAVVAAARTAHELGAPLAAMLQHVTESLAADAAERDDVEAALAGPRATARVLAWLPLLGVGLGALLGADPVGVLLGGGLGSVAGLTGLVLLVVGRRWTSRLLARAARGSG